VREQHFDFLPFTAGFDIGIGLRDVARIQRNAVSHVAHTMQSANLIRYSRGVLEILDFDRLHQQSCECYDTVGANRTVLETD
jgi:hypothetical protein